MKTSSILKKLNRRDTRIIPKLPLYTKFILIVFTLIGISLFSKTIFAQTFNNEYLENNTLKQKQEAIKKGNNQEAWLNESLSSNSVSALLAITGEIPDDVILGKQTSWVPQGMIGVSSKALASVFNQPASGISYVAQLKDNFLSKPAYAQNNGIGFDKLSPILPIWKTFRNMTYIISSLLFVLIGLAIMLRVKVSPQAIITIQSSIPKIITTLILITFSYAIVGLIIDISYFVQAAIIALLFNSTNVSYNQDLFFQNQTDGQKVVDVITRLFTNPASLIKDFIDPNDLNKLSNFGFLKFSQMVSKFVPLTLFTIIGALMGALIGALLGLGIVSGATAPIGAGIGAVLFTLIFSIFILVQLISTFIGLVKAYFSIIIHIIMAPLEIFIGALPNSKQGFNTWLLNIIANISVFPIVSIFVVLILLILKQINISNGIWMPSLIDAGMAGTSFVEFIIGFGALLILPKIPKMVPEFVFQIKPSPWGKALGESMKPLSNTAKFGRQAGLESGAEKLRGFVGPTPTTGWTKALDTGIKAAEMTGIIKQKR